MDSVADVELLCLETLQNIPVLPKGKLTKMLKADNLIMVLGSLARLAPLLPTLEMREVLEWSKPALITHKWVKKHLRTPNAFGTLELSNDLLRFACLVMIKSSQAEFTVSSATRVLVVQGLSIVPLRYDDINKELVFGT